jgi:hypothetical protein
LSPPKPEAVVEPAETTNHQVVEPAETPRGGG